MLKGLPVCLALLILLVVLISGCGGGNSTPLPIAGDFFPLTAGRTWNYNTVITVQTLWAEFKTNGTFTRHVTGIVPLTIHGSTVNTYEVVQTATVDNAPTDSDVGPVDQAVVRAVNYIFEPNVGLQEVHAYYHVSAATADVEPRITLVALAENGGPVTPTPGPQPFFLNPPFGGFAHTESLPFIPLPLMPPTATLSTPSVSDKVLAFTLGGDIGNSIFDIYYYAADVNFNGTAGQMSGRGRNFMLPDIGLASQGANLNASDWTEVLQAGGYWARVTITLDLQ